MAEALLIQVRTFPLDPLDYNSFIMAFDTRIASRVTSDADKLYYLEQHVEGEAKELISGCMYMTATVGYAEARHLVHQHFGDPYKVSSAYVNRLLGWPPLRPDDNVGLRRLSYFLIKCPNAMSGMPDMSVLNHVTSMQAIVQKLPVYIQNKWRSASTSIRRTQHILPVFNDLVRFTEEESDIANDPVYSKQAISKPEAPKNPPKPLLGKAKVTSFATDVVNQSSKRNHPAQQPVCLFCEQSHDLENCSDFVQKPIDDKRSFLSSKRFCFSCYGSNHISRGCTQKRTCKVCGKRHPTAMHIENFALQSKSSDTVSSGSAVTSVESVVVPLTPLRLLCYIR